MEFLLEIPIRSLLNLTELDDMTSFPDNRDSIIHLHETISSGGSGESSTHSHIHSHSQNNVNWTHTFINNNESFLLDFLTSTGSISSIPIEFREMTQTSRDSVIAYTCLFIIALFGNLSVFYSVLKQIIKFKIKTRLTLLILHLSIADLIVTFFLIPMEIFWRISIQWYGGNFLCKICQFFRAFGLYLSSMVIICISMDRYFAVNHPLRVINGKSMVKYMLTGAWILSILCSLPQSLIFSVKSHPVYTTFQNCVAIGYFKTKEEEVLYNVFSIIVMYFAPLVVILYTYSMILKKITKKTKEHQEVLEFVSESLKSSEIRQKIDYRRDNTVFQNEKRIMLEPSGDLSLSYDKNSTGVIPLEPKRQQKSTGNEILRLRRSDNGGSSIMRARNRTVRLTLVIVCAFVFCATPYIFMTLWYMFDRDGATKVDGRLQDIFFMMAVGNSCANPLIYGSYTKGCNVFCGFGFIRTYFRKKSAQRNSQQSRSGTTNSTITGVVVTRISSTIIPSNGNANGNRYEDENESHRNHKIYPNNPEYRSRNNDVNNGTVTCW